MAKHLIQILLIGTRAVGRAFVTALRQEYHASQAAAAARRTGFSGGGREESNSNDNNTSKRLGISIEEARQILNVDLEGSCQEEVQKRFDHLFKINGASRGGSLYIQSKIYRAKERLDEHYRKENAKD